MKKLFLSVFTITTFVQLGISQKTYVPDDNFEAYLEANGMGDGIANNDSVTTANISSITNLNVDNQSIDELTGIEDFMALTDLSVDNNNLTILDLSNNTSLINLSLLGNSLTALDLRNGNNINMNTPNLPDIGCISVDSALEANANWTNGNNTFCNDCFTFFISNLSIEIDYYSAMCYDPWNSNCLTEPTTIISGNDTTDSGFRVPEWCWSNNWNYFFTGCFGSNSSGCYDSINHFENKIYIETYLSSNDTINLTTNPNTCPQTVSTQLRLDTIHSYFEYCCNTLGTVCTIDNTMCGSGIGGCNTSFCNDFNGSATIELSSSGLYYLYYYYDDSVYINITNDNPNDYYFYNNNNFENFSYYYYGGGSGLNNCLSNWGYDGFELFCLAPGNYTVTISKPLSGCTESTSFTIGDYPSNFSIDIDPSNSTYALCPGDSSGIVNVVINGSPSTVCSYGLTNWSGSMQQYNVVMNSNTSFTVSGLPPGTYDFYYEDDNGCYSSYYFDIYADPSLCNNSISCSQLGLTASLDTICEGSTTQLSFNGNFDVLWANGDTSNNINISPTQSSFFPLTAISGTNTCYDSIYIHVLNNSTFSEVITLCDSIVWNGVTYDSSGVYSDTIQNSLGCDSILILDVTFAQPTYGNETLTACDSVTWNGITYDSSGTFIDTIPNHLGCDSIVTIDVNLVGNYDMRFLVAPVSLIAPPFIFPFINATPNLVNYDFTWDFGDGTVIATNDTNITHEYQYNGVYTVKLIAEDMVNNCGIDTLEKPNLINCSGGPSLSIAETYNNLVLYPNPAIYMVNISYGIEENFNNHYVEIINSLGQQVFLNTIDASNIQIPVSDLGSKGLYFINISNESNEIIVTKHLIIN